MSKLAGKDDQYNLSPYEIDKCKKDTIAFDGDICVTNASHFCLNLKGEERRDGKNKILEYNIQLHAQNGSAFDNWINLNNLSCDKRFVNIIKNGRGIIELKKFNG